MRSASTLISVGELAQLKPLSFALFDCRFDLTRPQWGADAYAQGHLPNARYLHLDRDLSAPITPHTGRHPLPLPTEFARRLGGWGVDSDTQVIAYDQGNGMVAARLWWMLRWVGHRKVAVLDGGLAAWVADGRLLATDEGANRLAREYRIGAVSMGTVDAQSLQKQLAKGEILLVDGRAADRFAGQNETIDPIAGHVPGARNRPFAHNLDAQGRFLPAEELRSRWQATLGERSSENLVLMCGSGVSACHNLLALEHAGLGGAKLYPGSWSEWIRDPSRPIATGPT